MIAVSPGLAHAQDELGVALHEEQEGAGSSLGLAVAVLPGGHAGTGHAERLGELLLRKSCCAPGLPRQVHVHLPSEYPNKTDTWSKGSGVCRGSGVSFRDMQATTVSPDPSEPDRLSPRPEAGVSGCALCSHTSPREFFRFGPCGQIGREGSE